MIISSLLVAGGAVAGSWVAGKCLNNRMLSQRKKNVAQQFTVEHGTSPSFNTQVKLFLRQVDDGYQTLIHNSIDRLFGESHQKHLQALGGTTGIDAIPPVVKQRNRQAGYAGVALVLVLTGIPAFIAASFAINLYLCLVVIQIGFQDMWEKRKLTARGFQMIFVLAVLFGRFLVYSSLTFIVGLFLEKLVATVEGHSYERLSTIFRDLPQMVSRLRDGTVSSCPLDEIETGDVVVVHAGEVIPVDGKIIAGYASIDQHALTGEAQPIEKEVGDSVFASTMILMGELQVQVAQAHKETLAAQIAEILNHTQSYQTKVALRGVEIADRVGPLAAGLGLLALPLWGMSTMLAIWCVPVGAMLLGTASLTLMAYLDMSARSNILVKDGRSLDLLSSIDIVVFDKTGTLTLEQPTVCGLHRCGYLSENDLLALAAAIEQRQSHPIAAAICEAAAAQCLSLPNVDDTRIEMGYGLAVTLCDHRQHHQQVLLGSQRYMALSDVHIPVEIQRLADERQMAGHSMVYLAVDCHLQGVIELQPTVRPEAQTIIANLRERGLGLAMITGDQEAPAQALAEVLGIERVFANVLPEKKASLVNDLQEQGRHVMFVGDGINDSIALKQATISVSISGATTIATDTAQIVLMDGTLAQLDTLFELAKRYERDMKTQYGLCVYFPAAHIVAILLFGLSLTSTYAIGIVVITTAYGLAFRPIWRQEQFEAEQQLLLTDSDNILPESLENDKSL